LKKAIHDIPHGTRAKRAEFLKKGLPALLTGSGRDIDKDLGVGRKRDAPVSENLLDASWLSAGRRFVRPDF
jgi:hypothetical protein